MMTIEDFEYKYESSLCDNLDIILSYLKDGDVYVDIGANTGLLAKKISDRVNLSEIILFEPIDYLVRECYKKLPNANIFPMGLSNVNGLKIMYASKLNFAYNKIFVDGMEIHPHDKHEIECVRFSDWVYDYKISKIDFIKIDAEGHDVNIIEGMFDWLDIIENKPYILFEGDWYMERELKLMNTMIEKYQYTYKRMQRDILLIPKIKDKILI